MLDQSHNVTDPIESLMMSAVELVRAYVQAHLVDREALSAAQDKCDPRYNGIVRRVRSRTIRFCRATRRKKNHGVLQSSTILPELPDFMSSIASLNWV